MDLSGDQFEQRGLAGTARSHDGSDLPSWDRECESLEDIAATYGVVNIAYFNQRIRCSCSGCHLFSSISVILSACNKLAVITLRSVPSPPRTCRWLQDY